MIGAEVPGPAGTRIARVVPKVDSGVPKAAPVPATLSGVPKAGLVRPVVPGRPERLVPKVDFQAHGAMMIVGGRAGKVAIAARCAKRFRT